MKLLIVRFGVQPSEIRRMTLSLITALLEDDDGETITLADTAALHRWMASNACN